MRIKYLVALVALSYSTQTFAGNGTVGIGIDIDNYFGEKISFPINLGSLLIEPTIASYSDKSSGNSTTSNSYLRDFEYHDLGIGIFGKQQVIEKTYTYFGARFGYQRRVNNYEYSTIKSEEEATGFYVAPTFGAEYYLVSKFSIGIDIGFQYTDLDVEERDTDKTTNIITRSTRNETVFNTITRLMARYYF